MDNKENNQDDLVVSSTGEMLTKEESEQRTIEVKEAPKQESVSDTPATETSPPPSDATTKPSGLAPPDLPTPPPTDTPKDTPATEQSSTEPEASADLEKSNKQPTPNSEMSDEAFAKRHSNQQRGVTSHNTRNNKKVLAGLIIFSAVVLCAIAVFVYISTQENVEEKNLSPAPTLQPEAITPIENENDSEDLIEEMRPDPTNNEDSVDSEQPVDDATTIDSDTTTDTQNDTDSTQQTTPIN